MAFPRINTTKIERDMLIRGWNTRVLARETGLHETTIARFLNGRHQTPKTLKRIAAALNKPTHLYIEAA